MTDYITQRAHRIYELAEGGGEPSAQELLLYRAYALLSLTKGTETTASDVHDAYVLWQLARFPKPRHAVPFNELPAVEQVKDDKYVEAIHRSTFLESSPRPN